MRDGEGEDDWGRGRGGRTAVAREGRMVEARWVQHKKKKEREGRKSGRRKGEKETGRVFSFDTPQREKAEKKMEAQGELWRNKLQKLQDFGFLAAHCFGPAAALLGKALQISQNALVITPGGSIKPLLGLSFSLIHETPL